MTTVSTVGRIHPHGHTAEQPLNHRSARQDTAKEYIDDGSFYLVNYDESRAFCKQVKIRC
jgi:hypothetical protein